MNVPASSTYPAVNTICLDFHKLAIRIVHQENRSWFNAQDSCRAMGIEWHRDAGTLRGIPDKWKGGWNCQPPPGICQPPQYAVFLSLEGVFMLAMRSRKVEAQEFLEWIAGEVLFAIAQHGFFVGELDPAQSQADWAFWNAREQRQLLRRLTVLRTMPIGGVDYHALAEFAQANGFTLASAERMGVTRQLLRESKRVGMPPIARPKRPGVPPALMWPKSILEQVLRLLPPCPQAQLPLN